MSPPPERLCIRGVRAIDPARDVDGIVDVSVEAGRIVALGPGAAAECPAGSRVVEGRGLWLFPGFVELHAQLGEPGLEYREDLGSGLAAAAAGGFTHVCSQPDTSPVVDRRPIAEALRARAEQLGLAELHPLAASTQGLKGEQLAEIGDLLAAGAIAVSSGRGWVRDGNLMRRVFEYCHGFGCSVMQKPQDPNLTAHAVMHEGAVSTRLGLRGWPRAAEEIALGRDLALCRTTGARYHATCISTAEGVRLLERAKADGLPVTCDVTPHHLLLGDESLIGYDHRYRVEPPLREAHDREALIAALANGTIDCVSSDHDPQTALDTECELEMSAPGMSGLELCLSLVWRLVSAGKLSPTRAIDALSAAPARALGLPAPTLSTGATADFTLFDPERRWTVRPDRLRSKGKNSPFVNTEVVGRVLLTARAGRVIFDLETQEAQ